MQASRALRNVLQKCTYLPALQALLSQAPPEILENVVGQFAKILPGDAKARKQFVTSGGLKKVRPADGRWCSRACRRDATPSDNTWGQIQEIRAEPGTELADAIVTINECFPEEIVRYYSPGPTLPPAA